MSKSLIFFYFCLAFVGGIFIDSLFPSQLSCIWLLGALNLGILLISVFWHYKKPVVIGFCLLIFVVGIWRHQSIFSAKSDLLNYDDRKEDITLIGTVIKEPDIRQKSQKLTVKIDRITVYDQEYSIKEKVLITARKYPRYRYGDKIKIIGQLETPTRFEGFNYPGYLAKQGIYSVMYWPKIEFLEKENYANVGQTIYAKILKFKYKLRESLYQNLSPPQSSILGAMILGDKRKISSDWKEKLNITGLRHVTAISGLHITILSVILMEILIGLGLWRSQAFYLTLILLILFIIMVGLPASAIRAGIMGGLFLLAQQVGRLSNPSRAIVFACTGMLAINPLLLKADVGFQLSFLAIMGIIYLGPIFRNWLKKIPDNFLSLIRLRSIMAMTFAAQVFTLPILVYNFGRASLVAPLTNILILPMVSFILGAGFLFGLAGMVWQPLGWVLSWPAWLLLTYLIKIVDWFSQIPLASITFKNVHWIFLAISYSILGFITWRLNRKQKLQFLNY